MSDNSVIAKSGWLFKLCDTGWAKGWVELYRDGYLKYYENDHSPNAEDVIFMPTECILIKTGSQVSTDSAIASVPSHHYSSQCLFSVSTSGKVWTFCGESLDDMRAWQLALEQARLLILPSRSVPRVPYASVLEMSPNYCSSDPGAVSAYGLTPSIYLPAYTSGSYTFYPSNPCDSLSFMSQYSSLVPSDQQHHPHPQHQQQQQPIHQARLASLVTASNAASPQLTPSLTGQPMFPHPRPDGRDVAFGMLAGAAVGSVVWGSPYFWW